MVIDFKCPMCAGVMRYDSESGKLTCDSCGYQKDIEETEAEIADVREDDGEREYICDSCGAVLVTEPEVSATTCPYCGSHVALGGRLAGELTPDMVIPFSVSKDEAKAAFKKWAKNGLLTPRDFMTERRLGQITGVYVPFWLYDMEVTAQATCLCTKKRSHRRGDYIIHETDYYQVYRKADLNYLKVPADASVKMDDATMDYLEPYHYSELKEFRPDYLAGYQAERYSADADELEGRVKSRIRTFAEKYLAETITGYSTTTYNSRECVATRGKEYYALLPVWTLQYKYKGEERLYAMNGQTGKVVGDPPISKAKVAKWVAILYGGSFALLSLLMYLVV